MCFWLHEKGVMRGWGSWISLQSCSSAAFGRISASATVSSSITCICPSSSHYLSVPFFPCLLPTHLYFPMVPVILYRPVSLPNCPDIFPHSLFLVGFFLCLTDVPLCPSFSVSALLRCQEKRRIILSLLFYYFFLGTNSRQKNRWAQQTTLRATKFYIWDGQAGKRHYMPK